MIKLTARFTFNDKQYTTIIEDHKLEGDIDEEYKETAIKALNFISAYYLSIFDIYYSTICGFIQNAIVMKVNDDDQSLDEELFKDKDNDYDNVAYCKNFNKKLTEVVVVLDDQEFEVTQNMKMQY